MRMAKNVELGAASVIQGSKAAYGGRIDFDGSGFQSELYFNEGGSYLGGGEGSVKWRWSMLDSCVRCIYS